MRATIRRGIVPEHPVVRRTALFIVLFNLALVVWLLLHPGSHAVVTGVDNAMELLGPLAVLPLCLGRPLRRQPRSSLLLGLAILSYAAGQAIWSVDEQVLHVKPFPRGGTMPPA